MAVKTFGATLAGVMLSAAAAAAPLQAQDRAMPVTDSTFVQMAASGGMAEVQLGKMAQQKATSAEVKQFAQRMVTDHTQANKQLMAAAQNAGMTAPTSLIPKHQQVVDRLSKQTGAAFDTAYMSAMVKDHAEEVQLFQQQSKSGRAESLKQVAAQTLPALQQHLTMAKEIGGQVGADTTTAGTAHAEHGM